MPVIARSRGTFGPFGRSSGPARAVLATSLMGPAPRVPGHFGEPVGTAGHMRRRMRTTAELWPGTRTPILRRR
ncbi:MAG: hypothetical protein MUF09_10945, partial [Candidatus Nanopelagicales bacterium]|nr:hypothetical protein [Candidatus Nanopelagicales bacterium]